MRHSKHARPNLAITDVLRAVSSADQESFNAAMEAAYPPAPDATPHDLPEPDLRDVGVSDDLVGAELWMMNFDESDEELLEAAEPIAGAIGFRNLWQDRVEVSRQQ